MADKLGLGREVRELKLGPSFSNKGTAFHTIRYDFKPASVDLSKMATVDMGQFGSVTVTVPHLDGAGTPHTVFRGNRKEYTKECVLIIDRNTGEITLEKLSYNIQVKKTSHGRYYYYEIIYLRNFLRTVDNRNIVNYESCVQYLIIMNDVFLVKFECNDIFLTSHDYFGMLTWIKLCIHSVLWCRRSCSLVIS
ncbi:hypothetical protein J437_LFUL004921 [Ladona fulva]|uniref:Ell-associated factor Eaf n=1 Tax=Ladona fulva TaxID=123851 RepID=A0A8K0K978_LADFU|nr:hypothetical protein J437_LFUL004921 [Ladona fulva]